MLGIQYRRRKKGWPAGSLECTHSVSEGLCHRWDLDRRERISELWVGQIGAMKLWGVRVVRELRPRVR